MSLLIALIIGGLVGWAAAAVGGRDEGIVASIVIGIVGAIIGGVLSSMISGSSQSFLMFSWAGLFWSFVGSLILVVIMNAFQSRSYHSHRM